MTDIATELLALADEISGCRGISWADLHLWASKLRAIAERDRMAALRTASLRRDRAFADEQAKLLAEFNALFGNWWDSVAREGKGPC